MKKVKKKQIKKESKKEEKNHIVNSRTLKFLRKAFWVNFVFQNSLTSLVQDGKKLCEEISCSPFILSEVFEYAYKNEKNIFWNDIHFVLFTIL